MNVTRFLLTTPDRTARRGRASNRHRYPLEDLRIHGFIPFGQFLQEPVKSGAQLRAQVCQYGIWSIVPSHDGYSEASGGAHDRSQLFAFVRHLPDDM